MFLAQASHELVPPDVSTEECLIFRFLRDSYRF